MRICNRISNGVAHLEAADTIEVVEIITTITIAVDQAEVVLNHNRDLPNQVEQSIS